MLYVRYSFFSILRRRRRSILQLQCVLNIAHMWFDYTTCARAHVSLAFLYNRHSLYKKWIETNCWFVYDMYYSRGMCGVYSEKKRAYLGNIQKTIKIKEYHYWQHQTAWLTAYFWTNATAKLNVQLILLV